MGRSLRLSDVFKELRAAGKCRLKEIPLDLDRVIELPQEDIVIVARYLRTLGETSRLKILLLLREGPLPVCVVSHVLGLDQTLVSHHMQDLVELGLVETARRGRFKLYKLTERAREVLEALLDVGLLIKANSTPSKK
ncbi:MAG: metalloregulator ArsR/SmtB family transcription factor [Zestosphaera sp.]